MTEHLNYCRQILRQGLAGRGSEYAQLAKKFMLPRGGILLEDESLRAIDETMELRLPFQVVALEFEDARSGMPTVIVAIDHADRIEAISLTRIDGAWYDWGGDWWMPKHNYMDRSIVGDNGYPGLKTFDGDNQYDEGDNMGWQRVLLSMINALSCSNVHVERSDKRKAGKKVKAGLPFDDYHILTIDVSRSTESTPGAGVCSHRSPREHLRRGHIVRPKDRRPYWRNATVVSAGKGFGKIEKDYKLRGAAVPSNVNVTGATRLHRGASVLTAGLAGAACEERDDK